MRKLFITVLMAAGFYTASFAQAQAGRTEFGANIGLNTSYVQESGTGLNSDAVTGFNAAASLEYYFSNRWSINGKLIYDQKGWGNGFITDNQGNEIDGVNFNNSYLTIPIMANWHFGRMRNWYLHFGPYFGFLLSAKDTQDNIDVKSAFNSFDAGLDLGIGVKFPVAQNTSFFVELDGQGGVTNIFKDTGDGSSLQNARSSVNIGFSFALK